MVKTILHILRTIILAACLTILTQVGGIIYLLSKPFGIFIKKKRNGWTGFLIRMGMYAGVYLFFSFAILPPLALQYNRVPLPRFANQEIHIQPARHFFWLANRHYVRKELYEDIVSISNNIHTKYPGTELYYLDANFPLLNYFPLLPHKSYNDGRRLDICFLYKNEKGAKMNVAPGFLAYGHCEIPRQGEVDYPAQCQQKGYRIYSALYKMTKHFRKSNLHFDEEANRELLILIAQEKSIRKIFIEPHLKSRLHLTQEGKIRFHGCGSVRHDDHIHMEL